MLIYYLYRVAGVLALRLPVDLGYWLADRVGDVLYLLGRRIRAGVRHNVRHVLGTEADGAEVESVVWGVLRNLARHYYDLLRLPSLSPAQVEVLVAEVVGWEHIESALAGGKGCILVSAHFGSVQIVVHRFIFRGIPVIIPTERTEPPILFEHICQLRTSQGLRLIPIDGPLLELFRALRRNEIVGLAADRDVTGNGTVVDFFGVPARLPAGPVQLALRTGAPLMVGFTWRLPDNRFAACFESPLELARTGNEGRDVRVGVEQVVAVMEQYIKERPDQWVMTVPLWDSV